MNPINDSPVPPPPDRPFSTAPRAARILARCRQIATHTETPGQTTRTFLSPPMHPVHTLLRDWMHAAGMAASIDAAGNLRGLYPATNHPPDRLVLGSHLDTVPNAGAFDGILGVVMAIAIIEALPQAPLPFALEIIGFSEEEGVRFRKPFLGSLAVVGALDAPTLEIADQAGITVAQAIRNFGLDPSQLPDAKLAPGAIAYLEIHIEQGPVLESATSARLAGSASSAHAPGPAATAAPPLHALGETSPEQPISPLDTPAAPPSTLGVVQAIVGQTRLALTFHGQANHAGTTPMHLRHDPLAAAAEWMLTVETLARTTPGLVATIGYIHPDPGVANVIPGLAHATLDVRHANDPAREQAVAHLLAAAHRAAYSRGVFLTHLLILEQPAVAMNCHLVRLLHTAVTKAGHHAHIMPSGAGHDAMILAPHLPSVMLFLPSPGGLSHHPDESVLAPDIEAALQSALEFLALLSHDETLFHA